MGTGVVVAVNLLFGLLDRAVSIKALIEESHKSGVDITPAQLAGLSAEADAAGVELKAAIEEAKREGR